MRVSHHDYLFPPKYGRVRVRKYLTIILLLPLIFQSGNTLSSADEMITISYVEEGNQQPMVVENPNYVGLYIQTQYKQVTKIEVNDISSKHYRCTPDIVPSPSNLARFNVNPAVALKRLAFRIKLPCAAYHNDFKVRVTVTTTTGTHELSRTLPISITHESPGCLAEGEIESGALT